MLFFFALLVVPSITPAARFSQKHLVNGVSFVPLEEHLRRRSLLLTNLASFEEWAASNCLDCRVVLSSLLRGVEQAGFLESASFADGSLKVKINQPKLYGEVATASNVPLMWKLEQNLTFRFLKENEKTVVDITGLSLHPPMQGQELYKNALAKAGLDGSMCQGDSVCAMAEIDAMYNYFKANKQEFKADSRKITSLFLKLYSNKMTYMAIKMKEGNIGFGKILYSLCTAVTPMKIETFTFEGGLMSMSWEPDRESPFYVANYIREKQEALDDMKYEQAKQMGITPAKAMALKQRFEGWFPGMSSSSLITTSKLVKSDDRHIQMEKLAEFGFTKEMLEKERPLPEKVAKLMSFCVGSKPGEDPQCKGSTPGRISWGAAVPKSMV